MNRALLWKLPLLVFLSFLALVSLFPMLWLFVSAFIPQDYLVRIPPILRLDAFSLENFGILLERGNIPRWFFNSLYLALLVTGFNLFFDTLAGYVLAKKDFPGRALIFSLILATMMIPPQVTLVPTFIILTGMRLIDTHWAILLPQIAGVFGIFLMKQYIQSLPTELLDAARVDGASEMRTFFTIVMPLAKPAMAVLGIFVFVANWNAFLWPLIVLNSPDLFTLQVGLSTLQDQYITDYGVLMAGAAVAAVPMILVFFLFQRYLIQGLTLGALKG